MTVLFSQACKYAIRALVQMARYPEVKNWSVHNLARDLHIPPPFLAKVFQTLAKQKILNSMKGRQGGFSFARAPEEIYLLEIVEAIDGRELVHHCTLGFPECGDENPCPFHFHWKAIRETLVKVLTQKSIAEFAAGVRIPGEVEQQVEME